MKYFENFNYFYFSFKKYDLRFLRIIRRGVLGVGKDSSALVLSLIITKFQKTCIHTLR
jgi:hypothetical protein